MDQKYRLVKTGSSHPGDERREIHRQSETLSDHESNAVRESRRKAKFWKGFAIFIVAAVAVIGLLWWMSSVSSSLGHMGHQLSQQSAASAKHGQQLSQIQSSLSALHSQISALQQQLQTDFYRLWNAITHSH